MRSYSAFSEKKQCHGNRTERYPECIGIHGSQRYHSTLQGRKTDQGFGGAVALEHTVNAYEPTVAQKSELNIEEKRRSQLMRHL